MVVYFSGTGNSKFAAKLIAHRLNVDCLDSQGPIKSGKFMDLYSPRPWVFVCPAYAWRIPQVFENFIRASRFSGSKQAYFIMTCGDDIGAAGERIRSLCQEKGFDYRGVKAVVMPENYLALFDVPDTDEATGIINKAIPYLELSAKTIADGNPFPTVCPGLKAHLMTHTVNPAFRTWIVKAHPFRLSGSCSGCGRCAASCPTNCVRMQTGKPSWGTGCVHCMACITTCPQQIIEYGKSSTGKNRYRCPEYESKGN